MLVKVGAGLGRLALHPGRPLGPKTLISSPIFLHVINVYGSFGKAYTALLLLLVVRYCDRHDGYHPALVLTGVVVIF